MFEAETIKIEPDMKAVLFSLFSSNQVFALSTKPGSLLGIPKNERVGRVAALCSHQRDLSRFQKRHAVLTDPGTQVRIPRREFSFGVTQGALAKGLFS